MTRTRVPSSSATSGIALAGMSSEGRSSSATKAGWPTAGNRACGPAHKTAHLFEDLSEELLARLELAFEFVFTLALELTGQFEFAFTFALAQQTTKDVANRA